ncbi:MAG: hypothetical protein EXR79_14375 [Myxococcales bacterium]|nr:hypothetical protein [Myxococcales bacterium]
MWRPIPNRLALTSPAQAVLLAVGAIVFGCSDPALPQAGSGTTDTTGLADSALSFGDGASAKIDTKTADPGAATDKVTGEAAALDDTTPPVDADAGANADSTGADTARRGTPDATVADAPLDGECQVAADCNDDDECTADQCGADGFCTNAAKGCDDGLDCTSDSCNAKTGKCEAKVATGFCVIDGACWGAGQSGTEPCVACDPNKAPTGWSAQTGKPCDDGVTCTDKDACTGTGVCAGKAKAACCTGDDDCKNSDPCQTGACDVGAGTCNFTAADGCCSAGVCCDVTQKKVKATGAVCGAQALASEYQCSGNAMQKRDQLPACDGKDATTCPQDDASAVWGKWLTVASCGAGTQCKLADASEPPTCAPLAPAGCTGPADCADTDKCTEDACQDGACSHNPKACPDPSVCQQGSCDADSGNCISKPKPDTCKISGQCYASGNASPADACQECNPAKSTNQWTLAAACGCSSGTCCDIAASKFKAKGTKCGTATAATEYQCSSDGKAVEKRMGVGGCTGTTTACSTTPANLVWQAWAQDKACASTETCVLTTKDVPGTCKAATDPLCTQKDDFDVGLNVKTAFSVGIFQDGSAAKTLTSKPILGGATDVDVFRYDIADTSSGHAPQVAVTWSAPDKVVVCAFYRCSKVADGKSCQAPVCPAGTTVTTNPDVSPVVGNGCCHVAAAGSLSWTPKASTGIDHSGTVFVQLSNNSAKCQQVGFDLQFGKVTQTACTPGTSCCSADGGWLPKGTKCGTEAWVVEYKCAATTPGAAGQVRKQYQACGGTSSSCSTLNGVWSEWTTFKTCAAAESCKAGLLATSLPTCEVVPVANLCLKADAWEGVESVAGAKSLGVRADSEPAFYVDPKVHLKSATDSDFFKVTVLDNLNTVDPKITLDWTGQNQVAVCAWYKCTDGTNGSDCVKVTCPAGFTASAQASVSAASPNGCCKTASTGTLAWSPDAPLSLDETGTLFFSITNASTSCQEVTVKIATGGSTSSQCSPGLQCCTGAGAYAPKSTACGTLGWENLYQCAKLGANWQVQTHKAVSGCAGGGTTCSSLAANYSWTPWTTYLPCATGEVCSVSDPTKPGKCKLEGAGSCLLACGGQSKDGACFCDAVCAATGDCCADFDTRCGGSCANSCGSKSKTGACYCDALCKNNGDCCLDKAAKCP